MAASKSVRNRIIFEVDFHFYHSSVYRTEFEIGMCRFNISLHNWPAGQPYESYDMTLIGTFRSVELANDMPFDLLRNISYFEPTL